MSFFKLFSTSPIASVASATEATSQSSVKPPLVDPAVPNAATANMTPVPANTSTGWLDFSSICSSIGATLTSPFYKFGKWLFDSSIRTMCSIAGFFIDMAFSWMKQCVSTENGKAIIKSIIKVLPRIIIVFMILVGAFFTGYTATTSFFGALSAVLLTGFTCFAGGVMLEAIDPMLKELVAWVENLSKPNTLDAVQAPPMASITEGFSIIHFFSAFGVHLYHGAETISKSWLTIRNITDLGAFIFDLLPELLQDVIFKYFPTQATAILFRNSGWAVHSQRMTHGVKQLKTIAHKDHAEFLAKAISDAEFFLTRHLEKGWHRSAADEVLGNKNELTKLSAGLTAASGVQPAMIYLYGKHNLAKSEMAMNIADLCASVDAGYYRSGVYWDVPDIDHWDGYSFQEYLVYKEFIGRSETTRTQHIDQWTALYEGNYTPNFDVLSKKGLPVKAKAVVAASNEGYPTCVCEQNNLKSFLRRRHVLIEVVPAPHLKHYYGTPDWERILTETPEQGVEDYDRFRYIFRNPLDERDASAIHDMPSAIYGQVMTASEMLEHLKEWYKLHQLRKSQSKPAKNNLVRSMFLPPPVAPPKEQGITAGDVMMVLGYMMAAYKVYSWLKYFLQKKGDEKLSKPVELAELQSSYPNKGRERKLKFQPRRELLNALQSPDQAIAQLTAYVNNYVWVKGENHQKPTRATMIDSQTIAVPAHYFKVGTTFVNQAFTITTFDGVEIESYFDRSKASLRHYRHQGVTMDNDAMIVPTIRVIPGCKNLRKLLRDDYPTPDEVYHYVEGKIVRSEVLYRTEYVVGPPSDARGSSVFCDHAIKYSYKSPAGYCGSPVFGFYQGKLVLLGIHCGEKDGIAYAVSMLSRDLTTPVVYFEEDGELNSLQSLDTQGVCTRVSGCVRAVGTLPAPVVTPMKTALARTDFPDPKDGSISPKNVTIFRDRVARFYQPQTKLFAPEIDAYASAATVASYMKWVDTYPEELRHVITPQEAVDELEKEASVGFGHSKPRSILTPHSNTGQAWDPQFKTFFDQFHAELRAGKFIQAVIKPCLKDEWLKQQKVDDKQTRTFDISPLQWTIIGRMYTGRFLDYLTRNCNRIPSKVGMDPNSVDTHNMVIQALDHMRGDETFFDADYKAFEVLLGHQMAEAYIKCMDQFYAEDGPVSQHVRRAYVYAMLSPKVVLGRDVYQRFASNPSGMMGTSQINSVANSYIIAAAYKDAFPDALPADFSSEVWHAVLGDDAMLGVRATTAKNFNLITFIDFCKRHRITVTDGLKRPAAQITPTVPLEKISFLQRTFKYSEDLKAWAAVMPLQRMRNQLAYCRDVTATGHVALARSILHDAIGHGKQGYEAFRAELGKVVPIATLPQWNEVYTNFHRFDQDLPDDEFLEIEAFDEQLDTLQADPISTSPFPGVEMVGTKASNTKVAEAFRDLTYGTPSYHQLFGREVFKVCAADMAKEFFYGEWTKRQAEFKHPIWIEPSEEYDQLPCLSEVMTDLGWRGLLKACQLYRSRKTFDEYHSTCISEFRKFYTGPPLDDDQISRLLGNAGVLGFERFKISAQAPEELSTLQSGEQQPLSPEMQEWRAAYRPVLEQAVEVTNVRLRLDDYRNPVEEYVINVSQYFADRQQQAPEIYQIICRGFDKQRFTAQNIKDSIYWRHLTRILGRNKREVLSTLQGNTQTIYARGNVNASSSASTDVAPEVAVGVGGGSASSRSAGGAPSGQRSGGNGLSGAFSFGKGGLGFGIGGSLFNDHKAGRAAPQRDTPPTTTEGAGKEQFYKHEDDVNDPSHKNIFELDGNQYGVPNFDQPNHTISNICVDNPVVMRSALTGVDVLDNLGDLAAFVDRVDTKDFFGVEDEMAAGFFTNHVTNIGSFTIPYTGAAQTEIAEYAMHPFQIFPDLVDEDTGQSDSVILPRLEFWGSQFGYWRGNLKFHFHLFAPREFTARLAFVLDYGNFLAAPSIYETAITGCTVIKEFDQNTRSCDIEVPFITGRDWMVPFWRDPGFGQNADNLEYLTDLSSLGILRVFLSVNPAGPAASYTNLPRVMTYLSAPRMEFKRYVGVAGAQIPELITFDAHEKELLTNAAIQRASSKPGSTARTVVIQKDGSRYDAFGSLPPVREELHTLQSGQGTTLVTPARAQILPGARSKTSVPPIQLQKFAEKFATKEYFTVSASTQPTKAYNHPQETLLAQALYAQSAMKFMKFDLKVRVTCLSSGWVGGLYFLTFLPYQNTDSTVHTDYSDVVKLTSQDYAMIDLSSNEPVELIIPYRYHKEFFNVGDTSEYYGTVVISAGGYAPQVPSVGTATVDIEVQFSAVNLESFVPAEIGNDVLALSNGETLTTLQSDQGKTTIDETPITSSEKQVAMPIAPVAAMKGFPDPRIIRHLSDLLKRPTTRNVIGCGTGVGPMYTFKPTLQGLQPSSGSYDQLFAHFRAWKGDIVITLVQILPNNQDEFAVMLQENIGGSLPVANQQEADFNFRLNTPIVGSGVTYAITGDVLPANGQNTWSDNTPMIVSDATRFRFNVPFQHHNKFVVYDPTAVTGLASSERQPDSSVTVFRSNVEETVPTQTLRIIMQSADSFRLSHYNPRRMQIAVVLATTGETTTLQNFSAQYFLLGAPPMRRAHGRKTSVASTTSWGQL
jgi:hypothetical protein